MHRDCILYALSRAQKLGDGGSDIGRASHGEGTRDNRGASLESPAAAFPDLVRPLPRNRLTDAETEILLRPRSRLDLTGGRLLDRWRRRAPCSLATTPDAAPSAARPTLADLGTPEAAGDAPHVRAARPAPAEHNVAQGGAQPGVTQGIVGVHPIEAPRPHSRHRGARKPSMLRSRRAPAAAHPSGCSPAAGRLSFCRRSVRATSRFPRSTRCAHDACPPRSARAARSRRPRPSRRPSGEAGGVPRGCTPTAALQWPGPLPRLTRACRSRCAEKVPRASRFDHRSVRLCHPQGEAHATRRRRHRRAAAGPRWPSGCRRARAGE